MANVDDEAVDRGDDFEESEDEGSEYEGDEGSEEDDELEGDEDSDESKEGDEEDQGVEAPAKKEPRVPKSRLDEVIRQREDAKERNLWLEEQLEKLINQGNAKQRKEDVKVPEVVYDYDAAEEKYISLIIEGEISKATKLRNEINSIRQEDLKKLISGIENKASDNAKSTSSLLLEKERFETSIGVMESKYPFLNHKDKNYNEEAVETVNTLLAGYVAGGKGRVESLQMAIKKVLPLYDKATTKVTLGGQRKVEAGKKAAQAAKQQPGKSKSSARTSDVGQVDINHMTDRDFSKLTAKEKSIMRGD